jgi:hypothetical protein
MGGLKGSSDRRSAALIALASALLLCAGLGAVFAQGPKVAAPPPTWDEHLKDLRKSGLEVIVVFDATGSMDPIVFELRSRFRNFAKVLETLVPGARIGFVAYRDQMKYDPGEFEFTVRSIPLTKCDKLGLDDLASFLRDIEAKGGGDVPEAVYEGIDAAAKRGGWIRGARKVIIVVGDAPPHAEDNGIRKLYALCKDWHATSAGVISCVDTGGGRKLMLEFKAVAALGGGEFTTNCEAPAVNRQLAVLAFGSRWEKEVGKAWDARAEPLPDVGKRKPEPKP